MERLKVEILTLGDVHLVLGDSEGERAMQRNEK